MNPRIRELAKSVQCERHWNEEDIENYFMQVSGYAVMFEERFGIPVNRVVVAIAVDDQDPQVFVAKRDTYISNLLNSSFS